MPKTTDLDQSFIQRVASGVRYAVSGVKPADWMSPAQPLKPIAQDVAGRAMDFPVGFNTRIRPKQDVTGEVTFEQLRALAESLDVLRLVIETRKDQIEAFDWDVVARSEKSASRAQLSAIREKLLQPSAEYGWSEWLRIILEDLFVLDAVAIYPRSARGGSLYSLDIVDAATIKRVIDSTGRTPIQPDPAYQQILKGVPAVNYTADELIYCMRNPRSWRLYGYSPVEQILMTVNIALRRQSMQLNHYTSGNMPEALASVPESWTPDQIAQFQMYFDSIMDGNQAARSKLKFLPLDTAKIKELKDMEAALKGQFDEWLARIVCYAFSVSPTPFIAQVNRATAESAAEQAASEGLMPILQWIKRLMDRIILVHLNSPDVEFVWKMQAQVQPLAQAQIDKIYIDAGVYTPDEVREKQGMDALSEALERPAETEPAPSGAERDLK